MAQAYYLLFTLITVKFRNSFETFTLKPNHLEASNPNDEVIANSHLIFPTQFNKNKSL